MRLCFNQADYDGMRAVVKSQLTTVNYCEMSATVMWKRFNDIMQLDGNRQICTKKTK